MATPPPPHHLDSVLSFSHALPTAADNHHATEEPDTTPAFSDADEDDFEFAFAPPLAALDQGATPADNLFAHGRIIPAYPLFDRHHLLLSDDELTSSSSTAAPDTYCAWTPRSAPGSPTREFPKSASTGEARRSWRLRDLVAGGGGVRSHSDGKEKFVFLQPTPSKTAADKQTAAASEQQKKQRRTKKGGNGKTAPAAGTTEMDLATAHRRFYGNQGGGGGAVAGERRQHQSYLPYRQGIVGFFTAAHALGRSHHPY